MKKLFLILVLCLVWGGSVFAQIIELDKCISIPNLEYQKKKPIWNQKYYDAQNTFYFKFLDKPERDTNNSNFIKTVVHFSETEIDNPKELKKYIKEGYKKHTWVDKEIYSIDLNRGIITSLWSVTDDAMSYRREEKRRYNEAAKKFNLKGVNAYNTLNLRQTVIEKFIIQDYVGNIIIGYLEDQERIFPEERWGIKIDLENLTIAEENLKYIHGNNMGYVSIFKYCSSPNLRINNKQKSKDSSGVFKDILGKYLGK